MNNLILGSGIVGLLAKAILGSDWKIIPFYKSRFFSYNPALDDNFIIADDKTDNFIRDISGSVIANKMTYRRAWSMQGNLLKDWDRDLCSLWLNKIFKDDVPPQSVPYYANRMQLPVYNIRVNQLYEQLLNNELPRLKSEAALGGMTEIGDHYIVRNGVKEEFDKIVSTIPLDALLKLMNFKAFDLKAIDLHYYHISTDSLDFEGINQQLVVDKLFDFYKVSNIAKDRYLFYCNNNLNNPGLYFMPILKSFEILDCTTITNVIPVGQIPNLSSLESRGIYCVGSSAQWDWCMDVGSCIIRLQKYSQRGHK